MKTSATTDPRGAALPEKTEKSASTTLQCQSSLPHRILVVDDDPFVRHLNIMILNGAGYRVDAAEDGVVAWDLLRINRYDLLVTDNNMPEVSGFELIKKLRAAGMALPVVMATGKPPEEDCTPYLWLQLAVTLLLKPYTAEEFLGTVKKALARPPPS
jgi:DNA-binding response OmpR family regulator